MSISYPIPKDIPNATLVTSAAQEAEVWRARYARWRTGPLDARDDAELIRAAARWYAHKMACLLEQER